MWIMGPALTVVQVQGTNDATSWGFRGLFGETLVLRFFTVGSVTNMTLRIFFTSSPKNMVLAGN
jgi:hypothetical protein